MGNLGDVAPHFVPMVHPYQITDKDVQSPAIKSVNIYIYCALI